MKILFLTFFCLLQIYGFAQSSSTTTGYVCPPCHSSCDTVQFSSPGVCPTCGMQLIASASRLNSEKFFFTFEEKKYSAEINSFGDAKSAFTIAIIPGHGQTDFVGGGQFYALRQFFGRLGFSTLVWDKAGCGDSEGEYNHQQSIENSAGEAAAAIRELRNIKGTGTKVGLWGLSRGGWICPLIIQDDPSISFWISVSGPDQFENFRYLLESNLRIQGMPEAEIRTLISEFDHYVRVLRKGGESYDQLVRSTNKLFNDPFFTSLVERRVSAEEFKSSVEYYKNSNEVFDERTGLRIYVQDFDKVLKNINCPVLALFGELDSQVDWRKTLTLYKETLGGNRLPLFDYQVLKNCNHSMMKCDTGGMREDISQYNGAPCDGYYHAMETWFLKYGILK